MELDGDDRAKLDMLESYMAGVGGEAAAGAHGGHEKTGEVDAQSTVIIVAFLIAMTLGFEFAKDMAEEA